MKVEGITWHGLVLEAEQFAATRKLAVDTSGSEPIIETEGWSLHGMPNGSVLDLFSPEAAQDMCPWA